MDESATITDSEFAQAIAEMRTAGASAGKASGSWIIDGNTSDATIREIQRLWDDGEAAEELRGCQLFSARALEFDQFQYAPPASHCYGARLC